MPDTLRTYLAAKLAADGYEGLAGEDCGCELGEEGNDLAPCGDYCLTCQPAHKVPCDECTEECCPYGCALDGYGFCMRPGLRPKEAHRD